jgi:hypothetical protein
VTAVSTTRRWQQALLRNTPNVHNVVQRRANNKELPAIIFVSDSRRERARTVTDVIFGPSSNAKILEPDIRE